MIAIAHDVRGLRIAAGEFLEEGLTRQQLERVKARTKGAANKAAIEAGFKTKRTVAAGYYERVVFLLWLAARTEHHEVPLRAADADALDVMAAARQEFAGKHPACPHCNAPLENAGSITCWSCTQKVKGN